MQTVAVCNADLGIVNAYMPLLRRDVNSFADLRRRDNDRPHVGAHNHQFGRFSAAIAENRRSSVAVQDRMVLHRFAKHTRSHQLVRLMFNEPVGGMLLGDPCVFVVDAFIQIQRQSANVPRNAVEAVPHCRQPANR